MSDFLSTSQFTPSGGKELPSGTRLEEFLIGRVLGSGGFGITYLARDTSLNRQVVIKENLPSQFAHRDTTSLTVHAGPGREDQENFRWSLENFSREGEMLASLRHPGIVPVLRRFDAFGTAYFVMPFVDGVPLDQLIEERLEENKPFSEEELRGLLEHVLAALDHLHQRGIYHRDIKPGNILITNDGIPVLIDFGSARQRLGERSMTVIESPGYTPFEQLQSRGNVGPWSDFYALGGTLEKAIAGQAPPKAMDRMRRDPRLPLAERRDLHATYTPAFLRTIDKALEVEESERWQDAGEWMAGLRVESTLQAGASAQSGKPSTSQNTPDRSPNPELASFSSSTPSFSREKMPKPFYWIIAACAILVLASWVIISANRKNEAHTGKVTDNEFGPQNRGSLEAIILEGEREESEKLAADQAREQKENERRKDDALILEKAAADAKARREAELPETKASFNEVGRQMAIMLQNSHFARLPFNAELSQRFLDDFLKDLDSQRLYFTQDDVDGFTLKYGDQLHTLLLNGNSMDAATEIYRLFEKRVEERVTLTEKLLKGADFDFTTNESVMLSRKDAAWPKNDKEATDLWRRRIQEAVLEETLRRESLTKLSKEQGKADPGSADRSPKEKIWLRDKRFLNSVYDVDDEEIANYFLSSIARSYDPHTDYMSFREMDRFKNASESSLVGIGALLQGEEDGATKITGIMVGGPTDREGTLKLNDRVVAVNTLNTGNAEDETDIMFMKIDKVVDLIRGKEGTSVALKVKSIAGPSGAIRTVIIQRGRVEVKDEVARGELIEIKTSSGHIRRFGVITLPSFYADFDEGKVRCSVDVEHILKRLGEEKIAGLILDLRNNGGGSLEEVRRVTGFFMGHGPVVQVKNTLSQVQVKESDAGKPIYTGPMVVITDKNSAGASEILAGALQDYNRAVIVGESSTFGQGTVQQPMDIGRMLPLFAARNRAGFLKVTIQKFYRPSGSSTQMDGVAANVVIPSLADTLEVGEAFLDHPLPHDSIHPAVDFKPLDAQSLFMPRLKELSQERLNASKDFSYVIEDVMKAKDRLKTNRLSLNKAAREKELTESNALQKSRNAERRARFAKMSEEDKKIMRFFKLTREDLERGADVKPYNPADENSDYMRRAKDETSNWDETPKWPTGLDPVKRESLMIICDFANMLSEK